VIHRPKLRIVRFPGQYSTSGNSYEQSVANQAQISLATDDVFSDGDLLELATVTDRVAGGFAATLTVAVKFEANSLAMGEVKSADRLTTAPELMDPLVTTQRIAQNRHGHAQGRWPCRFLCEDEKGRTDRCRCTQPPT